MEVAWQHPVELDGQGAEEEDQMLRPPLVVWGWRRSAMSRRYQERQSSE